ncbi:MAG TPA: ATP-dependent sacrificial sulfur transferase LarE [Thermodesulfobacteriota bacterium]|nr:ATP-dependent sacrificial sulfur transferase LarE [Thermodesulfobacteriota bacterium]
MRYLITGGAGFIGSHLAERLLLDEDNEVIVIDDLMENLGQKYKKLRVLLKEQGPLIVAFSGGVDSALLLKVAYDVLGDRVLAVTADTPSLPRKELEEAKRIAKIIGVRHLIISTEETRNENYLKNPANRCYFCKSELYSRLLKVANEENIRSVANGTNLDDLRDYRPGLQAAQEYKIISPLRDAGLTKTDIRALAQKLNLAVWDKPANPCLSSRIPYGSEVTLKKLSMIEEAEDFIKGLDIKEIRVRHFGKKARIEVNKSDFETISKNFSRIVDRFKTIGFDNIELKEFRSGSLNSALNLSFPAAINTDR